ncbi:hypothetical protein F8B43_3881 [Methylorubrum populi]|uniref:Uncharacterized protein n=1 Tax=Methylorubrum populi TaxID=223967 RepID=A0A833MZP2_9HYPH|nr:hypothetical protein F8B43_3881 [Methylorubrum populi]
MQQFRGELSAFDVAPSVVADLAPPAQVSVYEYQYRCQHIQQSAEVIY